MSPKPALRTVVDFQDLGQNIFLYKPEVDDAEALGSKEKDNLPPPSLVILCTWLGGATTKRIDKYIIKYQQFFPNACILLIRTTILDITLHSFRQIRARLVPARNAICTILGDRDFVDDSSDGCVLLHIFSHGGCNTGIQLALSMRENRMPIPLRGIIFDCCPGDATFQKAYNAAVLSLPRCQPAQSIGRLALYPIIAAITGLQHFGVMNSVREMRAQLNGSAVFGTHAARLYLYSVADQMVEWQDVQSHLKAARTQGYRADGVMFYSSPHCALILEDKVRYWAAIQNFWQFGDLSHVNEALGPTAPNRDAQLETASLPLRSRL
ncbi:MAG: hypothetical protein Q9187_000113 [Circinaria calcarea]